MAGIFIASGWEGLASVSSTKPPSVAGITYGRVPDFKLTDQGGQPFTSAWLKGRVWIADFIFTSCAGQCPEMTQKMRILQDRLDPKIHLVSFSVDPARDTPSVLFDYAKKAGADPSRWTFLTGEKATLEQLAQKGFHLSFADGGTVEEPFTHSVRLVLVDSEGGIRGYYDATDAHAVEKLVKDLQALRGGMTR